MTASGEIVMFQTHLPLLENCGLAQRVRFSWSYTLPPLFLFLYAVKFGHLEGLLRRACRALSRLTSLENGCRTGGQTLRYGRKRSAGPRQDWSQETAQFRRAEGGSSNFTRRAVLPRLNHSALTGEFFKSSFHQHGRRFSRPPDGTGCIEDISPRFFLQH